MTQVRKSGAAIGITPIAREELTSTVLEDERSIANKLAREEKASSSATDIRTSADTSQASKRA